MTAWIGVALGFLIGAFPTSYVVVKWRIGKDIRTMGSGNPGATNVFRCVGKKEGFVTLFGDMLKGILAVVVISHYFYDPLIDFKTYQLLLGIAAILGHVFTPFLGFKGGKGVATGAGVAIAVYPVNFAIAFIVWLLLLFSLRYMAVASIAAAYCFAVSSYFTRNAPLHVFIGVLAALFITWTHRTNLRRLFKGEEPRVLNFLNRKPD